MVACLEFKIAHLVLPCCGSHCLRAKNIFQRLTCASIFEKLLLANLWALKFLMKNTIGVWRPWESPCSVSEVTSYSSFEGWNVENYIMPSFWLLSMLQLVCFSLNDEYMPGMGNPKSCMTSSNEGGRLKCSSILPPGMPWSSPASKKGGYVTKSGWVMRSSILNFFNDAISSTAHCRV